MAPPLWHHHTPPAHRASHREHRPRSHPTGQRGPADDVRPRTRPDSGGLAMHVYRKTREGNHTLYTVGYFMPVGREAQIAYNWVPLADFAHELDARALVNYLNGGFKS